MEPHLLYSEPVDELRGWCQGEALDERHTIMVLVPGDREIEKIEETLQSIKSLGRVRVRGRKYNKKLDRMLVLCECKGKVDSTMTPGEVVTASGAETWPIVPLRESSAIKTEALSSLQNSR